jgi:predicted enzyme related to lactoylglutathione lyase
MQHESMKPTTDGPNMYFDAGEDLSIALVKVEAAGGEIMQPKTAIGENGFMALFIDTEGNKMALHSMK